MSNTIKQLEELSGSKYQIADGEPDIRGWDVQTREGEKIGGVDDLLFDESSRKVRYLIVDIDDRYSVTKKDRRVLVPIGVAILHKENDEVLLPGVTLEQLAMLPRYEKGNLSAATERTIRNVFELTETAGLASSALDHNITEGDFYEHGHFDENRFYQSRRLRDEEAIPIIKEDVSIGKRVVETGGVNVRTNIVEIPVEKTVNLKEEYVTVERRPVNKNLTEADFPSFQESTIEFTEHAEVPIISKEARVVEEISLKKEVNERNETIKDSIRETKVDVEELKDNRQNGIN